MRSIKILSIVFMLMSVTFCLKQKGPSEEDAYPAKTEIVDGIPVITNPDFPRDGRHVLEFEEELSIGVIEGDENYMLSWPYDIEVDEDEDIYVLDWQDDRIQVYDKNGKYIRTAARKGRGPGEFEAPAHIRISTDGKLILLGSRHRRLQILDLDGEQLSGFMLEGYCSDLKIDGMNRLYYHTTSYEAENVIGAVQIIERTFTIHRRDLNGQNLFSFGNFRGNKIMYRKVSAKTTSSGSSPHSYLTAWTVDRKGRLLAGYSKNYQMSVFNPDGQLAFKFGRDFAPLKNEKYKEGSVVPEYWPAFYRRLYIDEEGNLWLRQYVPEEEGGYKYDIFSPEGIYLKQVVSPHPITKIKNGKFYCIVRTEEDYRIVKRFRLASEEK